MTFVHTCFRNMVIEKKVKGISGAVSVIVLLAMKSCGPQYSCQGRVAQTIDVLAIKKSFVQSWLDTNAVYCSLQKKTLLWL